MLASTGTKMSTDYQNGLFSVIVPTFNRAQLVAEALDSVHAQTYRPIELIIVDDGSTDNTKEVVDKWSRQCAKKDVFSLRYIYQDNAGPSAARNNGITKVSGEYVQFLDSDDRIHPHRFERLVATFKEQRVDFIQTGFEGFDAETGEIIEQHFGKSSENQVELALRGSLWANTLRSAFKRSLVEKIGPWDTEMICFEDRDYVERAVVHADNPVAIRDILASARRGGSVRVSDRLRTYEGRKFRILCEERLCKGVLSRTDIGVSAKQAFASRLYALGFRSNASGWSDHGKWCGEIARSMGIGLDAKGKLRRLVWRSGRIGGMLYRLLSRLKHALGSR